VDKELGDLQKTLKNIEDARPFADLTVVRTYWRQRRWRWMLMAMTGRGCGCSARNRPAHRAARVQGPLGRSWLQGKSSAMENDIRTCTNNRTGEVRRSVRPISVSFFVAKTCPIWVVLPHIVNSSRNASIEFDVHHHMPSSDIVFHFFLMVLCLRIRTSITMAARLTLGLCDPANEHVLLQMQYGPCAYVHIQSLWLK
jgi:hypothetical protein